MKRLSKIGRIVVNYHTTLSWFILICLCLYIFLKNGNTRNLCPLPLSSSNERNSDKETSTKEGVKNKEGNRNGKTLEKEILSRKTYLKEKCEELHVKTTERLIIGDQNAHTCRTRMRKYEYSECIFSGNFIMSKPARSLACFIPKVASTSLVVSFFKSEGKDISAREKGITPHIIVNEINPKTLEEFAYAGKHFTKILLVRHPIRRLYSAYANKVVDANNRNLKMLQKYVKLRAEMLKRKGKMDFKSPNNEDKIEEWEAILDERLDLFNATGVIPTFEEFLEYIFSTDLQGVDFENHWVPYWVRCAPCSINFDVVVKMENGRREFEYIWEKLGLKKEEKIPWENQSTGLDDSFLRKSFHELSSGMRMKIYEKFYADFVLFNYTFTEFM